MKIRVLDSIATFSRAYTSGEDYTVGIDIDQDLAEAWIRDGVAVLVKEKATGKISPDEKKVDGPKETKTRSKKSE